MRFVPCIARVRGSIDSSSPENKSSEIFFSPIRKSQPPKPVERPAPVYTKFAGGLDAVRAPGAPTVGDLRKVYAAEGLDRLTCGEPGRTIKPDPSAPLP